MMKYYGFIAKAAGLLLVLAAAGSCIENDTAFQTARCVIEELEAEGQKTVTIDAAARTVVIDLEETVDPREVEIVKFTVGVGAECSVAAGSVLDLSQPVVVLVSAAVSNEWTISATQTIDRYLTVAAQLGESYVDEKERTILAYVPKLADLTQVNVTGLKLGPPEADYEPELSGIVNFQGATPEADPKVYDVRVKYRDVDEVWKVAVERSEPRVTRAAAFAKVAWLTGFGVYGLNNGFEYRPAAEADGWKTVPAADVEHNGGVFEVCLRGLEPLTSYVVRAFSGDDYSKEVTITTEKTRELSGGGFDEWHQEGKVWNPWAKNGTQLWDTGNKGAVTLGNSNSIPTDAGQGCPANPGGRAAYLETRFVGLAGVGKVAGGNIYFGHYYDTQGTNGRCDIGQPWDTRPTKLKGYYKYFPKAITDVGSLQSQDRDYWLGSMDSLNICIALWSPQADDPFFGKPNNDGYKAKGFVVDTNPKNFRDFTEKEKGVIAYGAFATDEGQATWKEFTIDIDYLSTDPLPANTVLFIMATASKNCNYFTAGRGSLLYLDELSLGYE